jgi:hypothetical protein
VDGRARGVDLGAGDQQHARIVVQALHGGSIIAQAILDAPDRLEQRRGVGLAATPGMFVKECAAAWASGCLIASANGSFAMCNP